MMAASDLEQLYRTDHRAWCAYKNRELELLDRMLEGRAQTVDDRETYAEFAAQVAHDAPIALDAMGVDQAFSRWRNAVDELHAWGKQREENVLRQIFAIMYLVGVREYRDKHAFLPPNVLVDEMRAQLRHDWQRYAELYFAGTLELVRAAAIDRTIADAHHVQRATSSRRKVIYG